MIFAWGGLSASSEPDLRPPRLAGKGWGEGEFAQMSPVGCPFPIPLPQAGEGTAPSARPHNASSAGEYALASARLSPFATGPEHEVKELEMRPQNVRVTQRGPALIEWPG